MIGKQILLVEDDPDIQHFVRMVLSFEGAELTVASTGAEALALCSDGHSYDLMILDLALPDLSGWEVLREVQTAQSRPRCKVVILSAAADAGSVRRAAEVGITYVTKPVDAPSLVRIVKRVLRDKVEATKAIPDAG